MSNEQRKPETPEQRREAEAQILRRATERPMGAGWGVQPDPDSPQRRGPPPVRR
jgi:hypothetical protein